VDPVTHLTTGALGGQAVAKQPPIRSLVIFTALAAAASDIDNLAGVLGPEAYLIHHRGITHSLFGGVILAFLLALAGRALFRGIPVRLGFPLAWAAVMSHIFLDVTTSYGTQILVPFTDHRYTVECVFIIDPLLTGGLIACLAASFRHPERRRRLALAGLGLALLYPLLCLGVRYGVEAGFRAQLRRAKVPFEHVHASPEFLTPFLWKIVVEAGDRYRMAGFNLLRPSREPSFEDFARADRGVLEEYGRKVSFFRTWAWFSVYPVVEKGPDGSLTFGDLRFHTTIPLGKRLLGGRSELFGLTAFVNGDGRLVAWEYRRPRGTAVIHTVE
jgi:inner membrane protein